MDFQQEVKKIAKRKEIPIKDLLVKLDMNRNNYYKITNPTIQTLERFASALSCEVHELIPVSDNFAHNYNNNVWEGILRKDYNID